MSYAKEKEIGPLSILPTACFSFALIIHTGNHSSVRQCDIVQKLLDTGLYTWEALNDYFYIN